MSTSLQLLDTPKRVTLQSRSTQIRGALKDFERTFATNNDGRKPSKDDIKADPDIATKYKEYNKIRDVLSGKLDHSTLAVDPKSPSKKRSHNRTDSGVSCTPKKKNHNVTPRKLLHPHDIDLYDGIKSASPKPVILHAIGPTPQRDGKVLGLFDLLSNSAHSSRPTPSSRKRKLDALIEDSPRKQGYGSVAQTPSRRKTNGQGDLLEHLAGTPGYTPETGHRKLSRTPVSEGRKFMLSQFFATPSAARFSSIGVTPSKEQTPLRNRVLGTTPDDKQQSQKESQALEATPAYLRRSTSFKDRLLLASQPSSTRTGLMSPPIIKTGPPTLRHFRSVKLFSDIDPKFSDIEEENDDEEYEDDLEALRELEDNEVNVLIKDSQPHFDPDPTKNGDKPAQDAQPLQKKWKKKGQKRTTRRTNMRPTQAQSKAGPKFVAAGDRSEDEESLSQVEETQLSNTSAHPRHATTEYMLDEDYVSPPSDVSDIEGNSVREARTTAKSKTSSADKSKKTRTINPNAVAHMNFRTLKIKNKNSKAKGRGRFSRGRR